MPDLSHVLALSEKAATVESLGSLAGQVIGEEIRQSIAATVAATWAPIAQQVGEAIADLWAPSRQAVAEALAAAQIDKCPDPAAKLGPIHHPSAPERN